MPKQTRLLAVVTARGGSKRLPRKNLLLLAGKPLIAWTIEAALSSGVFAEVLVSTDDPEIAQIARDYGATVPWLRPEHLSGDTARSIDVIRHAMIWYETWRSAVDGVALLQPTNPFRTATSISDAAAQYLSQTPREPLVSVSPAPVHPAWCFRLDGGQLSPFTDWSLLQARSQDLPPAFSLNGAIYILPPEEVRSLHAPVGPRSRAFVMDDPDEALDIDDERDWQAALAIAMRRQLIAQSPA